MAIKYTSSLKDLTYNDLVYESGLISEVLDGDSYLCIE